jgi:hypothetical protein
MMKQHEIFMILPIPGDHSQADVNRLFATSLEHPSVILGQPLFARLIQSTKCAIRAQNRLKHFLIHFFAALHPSYDVKIGV